MKIGYYAKTYPNRRNIINKINGFIYKEVYDLNKFKYILLKLVEKFTRISYYFINDLKFSFKKKRNAVNILHFFNTISYGQTPWITTYETLIPRYVKSLSGPGSTYEEFTSFIYDNNIIKALKALSGDSCKKIVAISECAYNIQKMFLLNFPEYQNKIIEKMIVLHPPQEILIKNYEEKKLSPKIHFMFVGKEFFKKGGLELLEAFCMVRSCNTNFKFILISSMKDTCAGSSDIIKAKKLINDNSDWIDFYDSLPNNQVLELMKNAHVGLLPTYAETYSFSVLEFQAAGCPVVTTNIRALPEINNKDIGWILDVPKNELGNLKCNSITDYIQIKESVKNNLKEIILEILNNQAVIKLKGELSLQKIIAKHSIENYKKILKAIYQNINNLR